MFTIPFLDEGVLLVYPQPMHHGEDLAGLSGAAEDGNFVLNCVVNGVEDIAYAKLSNILLY